ncbi:MAG: hypothetical protein KBC62_00720 [Candidatus Pacebacteria bacterium]|nr:hypothetical protein [Candidatus Paceibacterota bacterium]
MFRGNSYSDANVRGVGAALLKSTVRQYHPDKIVTFTSEERVYGFLSYFGDILPAFNKRLEPEEMELMSRLAGCKHTIEADTMIVKNFYQEQHIKQGGIVRDKNISNLFSKLNYRDAFALLIRVS